MSEVCKRCGSVLKPYYWETQIPQGNWTREQAAATAQRQEADKRYNEFKDAVTRSADSGGGSPDG